MPKVRKYTRWEAGRVVGNLTLVERTARKVSGAWVWRCRCQCGSMVEASVMTLNNNPNHRGCKGCHSKHQSERATASMGKMRERWRVAAEWYADGMSMAEVGKHLGVSKQRVEQIIKRFSADVTVRTAVQCLSLQALREAIAEMPMKTQRRIYVKYWRA
jgi:hypothetical protein